MRPETGGVRPRHHWRRNHALGVHVELTRVVTFENLTVVQQLLQSINSMKQSLAVQGDERTGPRAMPVVPKVRCPCHIWTW